MKSKHFSDISIERVYNEALARVLGGTWIVVYKRDGVMKSNTFNTAGVAASFASKLENGDLDDDALNGTRAQEAVHEASMLRQQNAELNAVLTASLHTRSLAYFAARAPHDIPDWFTVPGAPALTAPEPHESITVEAREWARDPSFVFDDAFPAGDERLKHADAYLEAMRQHSSRTYARTGESARARYFAWRWHYAEQMVAMGAQVAA